MNWKNNYRSFYDETTGDLGDVVSARKTVALLVIDMQNMFVKRPSKTWELKIINNIYCNEMSSDDVIQILNNS